MKFGVRLSIYYLAAVLISMTLVGLAVVKGIEQSGMHAVEQQLINQSESAQVYVTQVMYLKKVADRGFTEDAAREIAAALSSGNRQVRVYDRKSILLSAAEDGIPQSVPKTRGQSKNLAPALAGNYAYVVKNNSVYFASPIQLQGKTYGILEFIYPLDLINQILTAATRILVAGAGVFGVLITVLSIFISHRLVKPIKQLVTATNRYAQRDFISVQSQRTDEFGRLSRSFNAMGARLQDYIERQKQFVSNVSHELRTPLTAIKGYSEYLTDEVKGRPDLEKAVYHLNNESQRLTNMVNELLLLSRIDAQREEFVFTTLDFTELAGETIGRMRLRAERQGVPLLFDLPEEEILVCGDSEKLAQVIINLLDNAIKYSEPGCSIEVSLRSESGQAVLEVKDRGMGIPPGDMEKVFDRFYRSPNSRLVSGTGLGLAITREIVKIHKGAISLNSRDDGGTVARLILPAVI